MRKRITSRKKKSGHEAPTPLREHLALITAALGFVKMVYDLIKDILN